MSTRCTIGKDGKHYYFTNGRRVSAKGLPGKSRIKCHTKASQVRAAAKSKTRAKPVAASRARHASKSKSARVNAADSDCISRSLLKPRPFQKNIIEFMNKNKELLICSGTGSGKTLTAVISSQCYLDAHPNGRVIVVMPAILIGNFQKELLAYGAIIDDRYQFYSFERFLGLDKRAPVDCKGNGHTLLIVDEAHNLRSSKSKRFTAVLKCAEKAEKKILLTATPFVNSLDDLIALLEIMYGSDKIKSKLKNLNNDETILDVIVRLMHKKIAIMAPKKQDPDYPTSTEHFEGVPVDFEYMRAYLAATNSIEQQYLDPKQWFMIKNPDTFMHGYRKAVNVLGDGYYSPKLKRAIQLMKNEKSIIYTNWIEYGIKPIVKLLKEKGITYREFHGGIPKAVRAKTIKDYNEDKFQVLIITKAGAEGIDLKGTRNIIILEPTWNDASLRQIIGRAIRFRSHAHLPANQRHVNIYKMIMVSRGLRAESWRKDDSSGDAILYQMIENKQKIEQKIIDALKKESIIE